MVFSAVMFRPQSAVTKNSRADRRLPSRDAIRPVACVMGVACASRSGLDDATWRSLVRGGGRIGLDRLDSLADLGRRLDRQLDQRRYLPFLQVGQPPPDGQA